MPRYLLPTRRRCVLRAHTHTTHTLTKVTHKDTHAKTHTHSAFVTHARARVHTHTYTKRTRSSHASYARAQTHTPTRTQHPWQPCVFYRWSWSFSRSVCLVSLFRKAMKGFPRSEICRQRRRSSPMLIVQGGGLSRRTLGGHLHNSFARPQPRGETGMGSTSPPRLLPCTSPCRKILCCQRRR